MIWRPFWIFLKYFIVSFLANSSFSVINSISHPKLLLKKNESVSHFLREDVRFPQSGVWEKRGREGKGWNWVFRLLGIFWMWILPESATGTSKRFAPKINSVRFFIVKHTSLARPFWQSSSERNVFVIILTRSKTSVLLLTNRQRHNSLQCFTEVLF